MPKIFWTIIDSLDYLKRSIKELEKTLKEPQYAWKQDEVRKTLTDLLCQGLEILRFAKPEEADQETVDFFLDRTDERPDLKRLAFYVKELKKEIRKRGDLA